MMKYVHYLVVSDKLDNYGMLCENIDFSVTRKAKSSQNLQDLHSIAEEMRIKPAIAAMHGPHSLVRFVD